MSLTWVMAGQWLFWAAAKSCALSGMLCLSKLVGALRGPQRDFQCFLEAYLHADLAVWPTEKMCRPELAGLHSNACDVKRGYLMWSYQGYR